MTAVSDLLALVERASGPSRDVDAALFVEFTPGVKEAGRIDRLGGDVGWWPKNAPYHSAETVPSYTASIDAALALVERKLPGWSARVYVHPSAAYADLYRLGELTHFPEGKIERRVTTPYFEGHRIEHRLPALAILAALLRALESETPA